MAITIEEFLLARIADAEKQLDQEKMSVKAWITINQILANQRYVIAWHKNFPILAETPPTYTLSDDFDVQKLNNYSIQMSKQMAWLTQEEYVKKFGRQPVTAPLLREMAAMYSNHPDWREEWA